MGCLYEVKLFYDQGGCSMEIIGSIVKNLICKFIVDKVVNYPNNNDEIELKWFVFDLFGGYYRGEILG